MKKWKQLLLAAGLTLCFGMAAKADTQAAAQVTGVRQTDDGSSSVRVECSAALGAEYYYLELSQDQKNWVTLGSSSSPSMLVTNLNAGASYYARVGLCTDYGGQQKVAGTVSAPIEVVTAPNGNLDAVQSDAKTNGVTVTASGTAISGANYYRLYYGKVLLGQSSGKTVASTVKMNAGTSYGCDLYACRKSASGYVAEGSYDYFFVKTLAPAINTKNFGVTNAWTNINYFDFGVSFPYAKDGLRFQFATPKGKVKKNAYTSYSGSNSVSVNNFIQGNFYKYRVCSFVQCGAKRVYSQWSSYKYIGMPKSGKFKLSRNRKALTFSFSKVSNASGYTVYASTKENSGYKKVKTLKAKKRSVTVKKVAGKKIKKNKKYYFKVVPNAKVGKKTKKSQNNMWFSYSYSLY